MSKEIMKKNQFNPLMLNPEIFTQALRVPPPQLEYDAGIWDGIVDRFRKGRAAKSAELDAKIAESNAKAFEQNLQVVKTLSTLQDDVYTHLKENDHKRKIWEFEEQQAQAIIEQTKMKTRKMFIECQLDELDFKKRLKEWESEYGTVED